MLVSSVFEQIVLEVLRYTVVVHKFPRLFLVLKGAFKQIERAIIFIVNQIFEIVFELHSQFSTLVVLSDFELEILQIPVEILVAPLLANIPIASTS